MKRKIGIYERYIKRVIDVVLSIFVLLLFSWLYLIVAIMVRVKLGSPIIFKQLRPGMIDKKTGEEKIFKMYKFRTMTDERDDCGQLLPDKLRLTQFGAWLRASSLDELPEVFNIIRGDMSIIGPRPQLIRDMVFMTMEQRTRHSARPGLSGLAQVNGRNAISWEKKFEYDLKYIEKVSFVKDLDIVIETVKKAIFSQEGITDASMVTAEDYGDYLLRNNYITKDEYNQKMEEALSIENKNS